MGTMALAPFSLHAEQVQAVRVGDRSVILHGGVLPPPASPRYHIERAAAGSSTFARLTPAPLAFPSYADTDVTNGVRYDYRIVDLQAALQPQVVWTASAVPRPFKNGRAFLELLQASAFDFFWFRGNPNHGLVPDRSSSDSVCSIASLGFAISSWIVGVEHGWIRRQDARDRILAVVRTLLAGPQGADRAGVMGYRGWFYHFLDMVRGTRVWSCELSSVDTAWLLAGLLDAREYFRRSHPAEVSIREGVDTLVARVDWRWMTAGEETLRMGWHPESGFIASRWEGYNEAMMLYILALGVPTSPLPPSAWQAWTRTYQWKRHYGLEFIEFPPLFGHQYSHVWIDFRGRVDDYLALRGISYFENSRRATLAQRQYCIANPKGFRGYAESVWGLTACDGPGRPPFAAYSARGAPPSFLDDGTLAPTAAGASLPFAPRESLDALRTFYDQFRPDIWCPYGFRDAFNLTASWWGSDVIGIDQGPILLMVENHRNGEVWKRMMKNAIIQRGLERAGFRSATMSQP